jgi:hypothetical protein
LLSPSQSPGRCYDAAQLRTALADAAREQREAAATLVASAPATARAVVRPGRGRGETKRASSSPPPPPPPSPSPPPVPRAAADATLGAGAPDLALVPPPKARRADAAAPALAPAKSGSGSGSGSGAPADTRGIHVVVTADSSTYLQWQMRVCYYHYLKAAAAPGSALRAFTRVLHTGEPDALMDDIPTVVVPLGPKPDSGGPPIQRPTAMIAWLKQAPPTEEYVLMLEPDHVLLRPVPLGAVARGRPTAFLFSYVSFAANEAVLAPHLAAAACSMDAAEALRTGNSPSLMHVADLTAIAPGWRDASLALHADPGVRAAVGWVGEMYGFALAACALKLRFTLQTQDLMLHPPYDTEARADDCTRMLCVLCVRACADVAALCACLLVCADWQRVHHSLYVRQRADGQRHGGGPQQGARHAAAPRVRCMRVCTRADAAAVVPAAGCGGAARVAVQQAVRPPRIHNAMHAHTSATPSLTLTLCVVLITPIPPPSTPPSKQLFREGLPGGAHHAAAAGRACVHCAPRGRHQRGDGGAQGDRGGGGKGGRRRACCDCRGSQEGRRQQRRRRRRGRRGAAG